VRNLVGPELSPTYEESVSFATWLLDNVDLEIPVIVEPMLQPLDHFPLHGYPPAAGDDVWQMFKRCIGVASTLHTSGLSNVWVIEYVTHPPSMCASRFPSFEPIRFLDFMPERYRALGYPNRQIE
jgi:hypothetical protein